jgi:hypothetical protein
MANSFVGVEAPSPFFKGSPSRIFKSHTPGQGRKEKVGLSRPRFEVSPPPTASIAFD